VVGGFARVAADLEQAVADVEHHARCVRVAELPIDGEAERVAIEPLTAKQVSGLQNDPAAENVHAPILPAHACWPGTMRCMDRARTRLEAEREQSRRRLTSLTHDFEAVVAGSRDANVDDEHDPEGSTIAFERSQVDALIRQTERHLEEIDAALQRLDAGTYGTCEVCGGPIGQGRLEARPVARTCIRCAGRR